MKMTFQSPALSVACLLLLFLGRTLQGAPIVAGSATYEYFNTFDAILIPDPANPFNPGPDPIPVTFVSNGVLQSSWGNQVGSTIPFEHTSFVSNGSLPIPFQVVGGIDETPALGPFTGEMTSVMQDPGDPGFGAGDSSSLISASGFAQGQFGQLIGGAFLYSDSPYSFEAAITALPYPVGTEFINNSITPVDVRMQLGPTPAPSDPIVATALPGGIVRITRIIPEPSALVLSALGMLAFGCFRQRRLL